MEKIASFIIDHTKLLPGIYVSRKDTVGKETITTFDIRLKQPNTEPVIEISALHTIEHLGATFLRNHPEWSNKTIYFGPMGCRTGFYAIFAGDRSSTAMVPLIKELFQFMSKYEGAVPGASPVECGHYQSQDLPGAKREAKKFLETVLNQLKKENLHYPE